MKKKKQRSLYFAICSLVAFALWTLAVCTFDVKAIGAQNTTVGFATMNGFVKDLTGVNMPLYNITDWLGLVPIAFAFGFAVLGIAEWIRRKDIKKVDYSILTLGGFYIVVIAVYILFENIVINYRPILISGNLEVSYPSSTTMLVLCVMPTAIMQLNDRIKNVIIRRCVAIAIIIFIVFMVLGRLISGVHWFSDIIGGALLSLGLVLLYRYIS